MNKTMKTRVCVFLLCLCCLLRTSAQKVEVCVNEKVELMSILSRLAGFPEYSMDMAGQYIKDMDAHFAEQRNHPAVGHMKKLRQEYGIAYDAVMSMAVHLEKRGDGFGLIEEETPSLEKRWEPVDKAGFLTLLNRFYTDSRFAAFFEAQQPLYRRGLASYRENVLKDLDTDWYPSFYGTAPEEDFSVIIGFCNGGGNYGANRHPEGSRKEVFAIVGYYVDKAGTPMYNRDYLPTLVHEFNHSFVNHLLEEKRFPAHVAELEEAGKYLFRSSHWAMSKQAYGNWQTVVNESLVRAAVICYMLDKGYERKEIEQELLEQIQRNFRWMPELVTLLRTYEKKQKKFGTLAHFYPKIISFFDKFAEKEKVRMEAIE